MKKIISNILIVIAVVSVLDFTVGRTLRYFYFKESFSEGFRTTYSMERTKADILVFGSSRANHHYIPEVFEDSLKMSCYNTGTDGNGIFVELGILKSVLKRYTPKVIILDCSDSFDKDEEAYEKISYLLPYYRTHKEIRKIVEFRRPFERIKLISEVYPFNSLLLPILGVNLGIGKGRIAYNTGYIPLYKEMKAGRDSVKASKLYEVDQNKLEAFREFIQASKKSGAKVFVVYSPVFHQFKENQDVNICNSICSKENITFWDFSGEGLFLNNGHLFQDERHLNHRGASALSRLIVNKIKLAINIQDGRVKCQL